MPIGNIFKNLIGAAICVFNPIINLLFDDDAHKIYKLK